MSDEMSRDELDRLLELADGPIEFPADQRATLRRAMLETASAERPAPGDDTVIRLRPADDPTPGARRRRWLLPATAACILAVIGAMVVAQRASDPAGPADEPIETTVPLTIGERCDEIRQLAEANGLIGDGAPSDADELDTLAGHLDAIAVSGTDDGIADVATRVRLLASAVADRRGGAVINTLAAIRDDVAGLFDPDAVCDR